MKKLGIFVVVLVFDLCAVRSVDIAVTGVASDLAVGMSVFCKNSSASSTSDGPTSSMLLPLEFEHVGTVRRASVDPYQYCRLYNSNYIPEEFFIIILSPNSSHVRFMQSIPIAGNKITLACQKLDRQDFESDKALQVAQDHCFVKIS